MKTRHPIPSPGNLSFASVRAFALGLVFASVLGAQEPPVAPVQLLSNGDLEASTSEPGWPDHWSRPSAGSSSWDEEDGRRYLRLNVTQPGEVVLTYRSITLPPEVKAVQLSLRARVIGLKCGPQAWFDARVMADFKTKDGEKVKGAKVIAFRKDTDGWVERSVRFAVPDGAAVLELMPTLFQAYSGTFDIDELLVTPIAPEEINPAPVRIPAPAAN
jgi:hypothetical protein